MALEFHVKTIALICKVLLCFFLVSSIAVQKSDAIFIPDFLYVISSSL